MPNDNALPHNPLIDPLLSPSIPEAMRGDVRETLLPERVLASLAQGGLSIEDRRRVIAAIEDLDFEDNEFDRLLPLLYNYILDNRDTTDAEERVAVAAAVRFFISELPVERVDEVGRLLEHGRTIPHLSIELEIAKMLVRKFTAHPISQSERLTPLAGLLLEIVRSSIAPSQLRLKWHAATCLQASIALCLMSRPESEQAVQAIKASEPWFREMFVEQASLILEQLSVSAFPAGKLLVSDFPSGKLTSESSAAANSQFLKKRSRSTSLTIEPGNLREPACACDAASNESGSD